MASSELQTVRSAALALRGRERATTRGPSPGTVNDSGVVTGWHADSNLVYHGFVRAANGTITTFDAPGAGTGQYLGTLVEYSALRPFIEVDFVNCLIHARIVCDRCIGLARHFIRSHPSPSFNSFHDHKRFFTRLQHPYAPHEEYAQYFRNNTAWFDMPLKPVRDQFFVHQGPPHMRVLGYESDHDLQMLILLPKGSARRPFEHTQAVRVSVRRLPVTYASS
jgi:hypothetical protein